MKVFKVFYLLIFFLLISFFSFSKPALSHAVLCPDCEATIDPATIYVNSGGSATITITSPRDNTFVTVKGAPYTFRSRNGNHKFADRTIDSPSAGNGGARVIDDKTFKVTFNLMNEAAAQGDYQYQLDGGSDPFDFNSSNVIFAGTYTIYPRGNTSGSGLLSLSLRPAIVQILNPTTLRVHNVDSNQYYRIYWKGDAGNLMAGIFPQADISSETVGGKTQLVATFNIAGDDVGDTAGTKTICVEIGSGFLNTGRRCSYPIPLTIQMIAPQETTTVTSGQAGVPDDSYSFPEEDNLPKIPPPCAEGRLTADNKCTAVDTAIGIIDTDPAKFVQRIFSLVLGLAGGIALILIIISGYKFMTSQGNPEKVKSATEGLTSAIVGLLFIIFAFVILQIVGVDILKIPGFE